MAKQKHDNVIILHLSLHVASTEGPQALYTLLLGHLCSVKWRYFKSLFLRTPHSSCSIFISLSIYVSHHTTHLWHSSNQYRLLRWSTQRHKPPNCCKWHYHQSNCHYSMTPRMVEVIQTRGIVQIDCKTNNIICHTKLLQFICSY